MASTEDDARHETEALIEAIWGPAAVDSGALDSGVRRRQNRDLAVALRAYLQEYLTEAGAMTRSCDDAIV